uniref:Uncharacterized protein n=1 Tax=Pyronema omphalodes (strain CBS 100304) TaxID=1076935 RepID=U4L003_PYROM
MYDDANRLMKPICYNPVIIQVTITSGTSTNSPKNLPISDWRKPELAVADAPSPLHSLIWRTRLRKSAERECSRMLSPAHRLQRERAEELRKFSVCENSEGRGWPRDWYGELRNTEHGGSTRDRWESNKLQYAWNNLHSGFGGVSRQSTGLQ